MKKEKKQRVYISGPLTDKKTGRVSERNLTAFKWAHAKVGHEGYHNVVNPTYVWACRWPWIYRMVERIVGRDMAYKLVLLYDLWLLMHCDLIYKIPGWQESRGANIESCVAYHFKIWQLPTKVRERIDRRIARDMHKWDKKQEINKIGKEKS